VSRRQAWAVMGVAMACAAALLLWLQRHYTFVADEVVWIQWVGTEPVSSLFAPYNGNLHVSTLLVARLLLHLFGTAYLPFGIFQVLGLWLCAGALYAYASRRVGHAWALAPAIVILFLGAGWAILLQPLIGTVALYSLGLGLCALIALERGDRRGDAVACALLCAALTFYTAGLAFLVAAALTLAFGPRADLRRRAWVVLVPALLYGGWRIAAHWIDAPYYVPQFGGDLSNLLRFPLYVVDSLALVAGALFGGFDSLAPGPATSLAVNGFSTGRLLGAVGLFLVEATVIAALVLLFRRRGYGTRRIWIAASMLGVLWLAQCYVLGAGRAPAESRYLFSGAFLLLVVLVEVARAVGLPRGRAAVALAAGITLLCVYLGIDAMRAPNSLLRDYATRARADEAMIELAGPRVDPRFSPTLLPQTVPYALYLTAGPWNQVAARFGSPSTPLPGLRGETEAVREEADVVFAAAIGLQGTASMRAPAGCGPPATGPQELPAAGAVIESPRAGYLLVAQFADRPRAAVGIVRPGRPVALRPPQPVAGTRWRVALAPAAPVRLCPLRG
jgi:hypothetical protein